MIEISVEETGEVFEFDSGEQAFEELARLKSRLDALDKEREELEEGVRAILPSYFALREHFFTEAESETGYKTEYGEIHWKLGAAKKRTQKKSMLKEDAPLTKVMRDMGFIRTKEVLEPAVKAQEITDSRKEMIDRLADELDGDRTMARAIVMEYWPEKTDPPKVLVMGEE